MNDFFRRTWAEIDLDAIAHNYHQIKDRLNPETKVCCVIKADAYGHGAELLAREYEELGADWFAVSNLEEAIQLRNAQIGLPILVLGYTRQRYRYEPDWFYVSGPGAGCLCNR